MFTFIKHVVSMCDIQFQSVRALINDFKYGTFAYKAAHIFFTDSKCSCICNQYSLNKKKTVDFNFL